MHLVRTFHEAHDPLLIAGDAAGDLGVSEHLAVQRQLTSCVECAGLHGDLITIAGATRALSGWTRTAPREFAITSRQAERLGRGSWLRRVLRPLASSRGASRPLAVAFTSLGLAGVLAVGLLPSLLGSAASSPASAGGRDFTTNGAEGTVAPVMAPGDHAGGIGGSGNGGAQVKGAEASPAVEGPPGDALDGRVGLESGSATGTLVLILSSVMLGVGLVLFALRLLARRVT